MDSNAPYVSMDGNYNYDLPFTKGALAVLTAAAATYGVTNLRDLAFKAARKEVDSRVNQFGKRVREKLVPSLSDLGQEGQAIGRRVKKYFAPWWKNSAHHVQKTRRFYYEQLGFNFPMFSINNYAKT